MKNILLYGICLLSALSASPAEVEYSLNANGNPTRGYGFDKEETYDVAIKVSDPSLMGSKITGLQVPLAENGVTNGSGWLSQELNLQRVNGKYVNSPDITTAEGVISEGMLSVSFSEPYEITGPLYVGYSFTVTSLDDATSAPVIIANGTNPDGLYLHSSRTKLKWNNAVEQAQGISVLTVMVDGNFTDNSASFTASTALSGSVEAPVMVPLQIVNHGMNAISEITYSYEVAGKSGEGSLSLDPALDAMFGAWQEVVVDLGDINQHGEYELKITVDKVNGVANGDTSPTATLPLTIYPFMAQSRPLVEEYTGLWCGYCPRGYVAMETLRELYGEQFVGIAYHSGDVMSTDVEFPSNPDGYPAMFVNRGNSNDLSQIYTLWPKLAAVMADADIAVSVDWTDDSHTVLRATSESRFLKNYTTSSFRVEYVLIIDGLSDPSWRQSNYYSPEDRDEPYTGDDMPGEWGKIFTEGESHVTGLTFNDVPLAKTEQGGQPNSIPSQITAGETYSHIYTFKLEELPEKATALIQNPDNLRVIAILLDAKTGKPVNSASSAHAGSSSSVSSLQAGNAEIVATAYFDLTGRCIAAPAEGICIRVDQLSNGSTVTTKMISKHH